MNESIKTAKDDHKLLIFFHPLGLQVLELNYLLIKNSLLKNILTRLSLTALFAQWNLNYQGQTLDTKINEMCNQRNVFLWCPWQPCACFAVVVVVVVKCCWNKAAVRLSSAHPDLVTCQLFISHSFFFITNIPRPPPPPPPPPLFQQVSNLIRSLWRQR